MKTLTQLQHTYEDVDTAARGQHTYDTCLHTLHGGSILCTGAAHSARGHRTGAAHSARGQHMLHRGSTFTQHHTYEDGETAVRGQHP